MSNTLHTTAQAAPNNEPVPSQGPVQLTLDVGPMAHGGHCVARHEGRVVFVRHAIPGEIVIAELTEADPSGRVWWADAVKVIEGSEFRRAHPWKLADPQRSYPAGRRPVDGAEYGHMILEHQRRVKAQVFRDTMARLGNQNIQDVEVEVQGMEEDYPGGLGWRTRNTFLISPAGKLRMPTHRSLDTVPVRNMPLMVDAVDTLQLWSKNFAGASRVQLTTPGSGRDALITIIPTPEVAGSVAALKSHAEGWQAQLAALPAHVSAIVIVPAKKRHRPAAITQLRGRPWVEEEVASKHFGTKTFRVSGLGSWPEHRDAASMLTDAVLTAADVQSGQVVANLYAGAGLFSAYLADAVGTDGLVLSVDKATQATKDARHNLQDMPQAVVLRRPVNRVLSTWVHTPDAVFAKGGLASRRVDTAVLSPPRTGAGKTAIDRMNQLNPDKIVYVAADPASLARDLRRLEEHGWYLQAVDVYDLHPNTHQMNAVSVFTRR